MQGLCDQFDYCFIAVKSYDTEWCAKLMDTHVKPGGAFISVQNGINDMRLAATVTGGASRCIGCVTTIGNGCFTPGEVIRWDKQTHCFKFGELDNSETKRIHELKALFDLEGGISGGADVTTNIWGARWSKLAVNCFINVTAGLSGLNTSAVRTLPSAVPLAACMAAECIKVAEAQGIEVEPVMGLGAELYTKALQGRPQELLAALQEQALLRGSDAKASMLQDGAYSHETVCTLCLRCSS